MSDIDFDASRLWGNMFKEKVSEMSIDDLWQERAGWGVVLDGKSKDDKGWERFNELDKEINNRLAAGETPEIFGRIAKTMEEWRHK